MEAGVCEDPPSELRSSLLCPITPKSSKAPCEGGAGPRLFVSHRHSTASMPEWFAVKRRSLGPLPVFYRLTEVCERLLARKCIMLVQVLGGKTTFHHQAFGASPATQPHRGVYLDGILVDVISWRRDTRGNLLFGAFVLGHPFVGVFVVATTDFLTEEDILTALPLWGRRGHRGFVVFPPPIVFVVLTVRHFEACLCQFPLRVRHLR